MIEITDTKLFGKVIADALVKVDTNSTLNTWEKTRWINAISKAAVQIEDFSTFMTWQPEKGNTLLIWSSKSNEIYEANGVCQCQAYINGYPCWHRAAKKIVENYLKAAETSKPRITNPDSIPYLKPPSNYKPEKVGNIRI